MYFRTYLSIVLFIFLFSIQKGEAKQVHLNCRDTIVSIDTNLHVTLEEVNVKSHKKRKRKHYRNTRRYWRTVRNIRKVYPYAKKANATIIRLNEQLKNVESKRERRSLIRKEYKGLMKVYKKPLMKLKISQGKLLMKLIDRETGNSSYYHLKELKGSFTAVFWQSITVIFGSSLKAEYDPDGGDWMVEEILDRIRKGELPAPIKLKESSESPAKIDHYPAGRVKMPQDNQIRRRSIKKQQRTVKSREDW